MIWFGQLGDPNNEKNDPSDNADQAQGKRGDIDTRFNIETHTQSTRLKETKDAKDTVT